MHILIPTVAGTAVVIAVPLLWRWFARKSRTQVHRINQ